MSVLQTTFPLAVFDAISHPVVLAGSSTISGVQVKKYSATITLADLESSIERTGGVEAQAAASVSSWPGAIPPASAIKIGLTIWVDSSDRIVRLTATQPHFMVNFVGGASSGALQFQPGYNYPGQTPSDSPYVQGYVRVTLDFSDFGAPIHIGRPPANEVARPNTFAPPRAPLVNPQDTCSGAANKLVVGSAREHLQSELDHAGRRIDPRAPLEPLGQGGREWRAGR